MYRVLTVKWGSDVFFTATTNPNADPSENILVESDMDEVNAIIETEPKLIGNGSYIVSQRIGERELNFTFNVVSDLSLYIWTFKDMHWQFIDLTFELSYFENDSTNASFSTKFNGIITKMTVPRGHNDWGDIKITALCVEPV